MTNEIDQKIEQLNYYVRILNGQEPNSNISESEANQYLIEFQNDPESFKITQNILSSNSYTNVKFIVLQNLQACAQRRWNLVDQEVKENIIDYLLSLVFSENDLPVYLINKICDIFNEILIQEYGTSQQSFFCKIRQIINQEDPRNPNYIVKYFNLIGSFMLYLSVKMGDENMNYLYRRFSSNHFNDLSKFFYYNDYDNIQDDIICSLETYEINDEIINAALSCCSNIIKCNSYISQNLYDSDFIAIVSKCFINRPQLAANSISIINEIFSKIILPDYINLDEFTGHVLDMLDASLDQIQLGENSKCWASFIDLLSRLLELYGKSIIDNPKFIQCFDVALSITDVAHNDILFESCDVLLHEYIVQAGIQLVERNFDTSFIQRIAFILVDKMPSPLEIERNNDLCNSEERRIVKREDFESMGKCISAMYNYFFEASVDIAINQKQSNIETIEDVEHLCWTICAMTNKGSMIAEKAISMLREIFEYLIDKISEILGDSNEYDEIAERLGICYSTVVLYSFEFIGENNELFKAVFEALFSLLNLGWENLLLFVIYTLKVISKDKTSVFSRILWENKTATDFLLEKLAETIKLEGFKDELKLFVHCLCGLIISIKDNEYGSRCISQLYQCIDERVSTCLNEFDRKSIQKWIYFTDTLSIVNSYVETFSSQYINIFGKTNLASFIDFFKDLYMNSQTVSQKEFCRDCIASILIHLHKFISNLEDPKTTIMAVLENDFIIKIMTDYYQESDPDLCLPQTISFISTLIARMEEEILGLMNDFWECVFNKTREIITNDDQYKYPDLSEELYLFIDRVIMSLPIYILSMDFDRLGEVYYMLKFGCNSYLPEQSISCLKFMGDFVNLMESSRTDNQEIYDAYKQNICVDLGKFCFELLIDQMHKFAIDEIGKLILLVFKSNNSEEFMEQFKNSLGQSFDQQQAEIILVTVKQILHKNADERIIEGILREFLTKAVQESADSIEDLEERIQRNAATISNILATSKRRQLSSTENVIKNSELPENSEVKDLYNDIKKNLNF